MDKYCYSIITPSFIWDLGNNYQSCNVSMLLLSAIQAKAIPNFLQTQDAHISLPLSTNAFNFYIREKKGTFLLPGMTRHSLTLWCDSHRYTSTSKPSYFIFHSILVKEVLFLCSLLLLHLFRNLFSCFLKFFLS